MSRITSLRRRLCSAAAAMLAGLSCATAVAEEPIRIGSFLSVTGPTAYLGDPELKTLELYIEKLNAAGGLLGRKLELVSYDDGGESAKANGFAKRLIENDHVDVIIGGTITGAAMGVLPMVEKAAIPYISLGGGVAIVEPIRKWTFKVPPTDRQAAERVLADMKKRGFSKIALLAETSGFGLSGQKETLAAASRLGISVLVNETFNNRDTDATPQLTKVKENAAVQALLIFGSGQGPAVATRNFAQLGMTIPLYQSHGVASEEYIRLCGKAAEGVRFPASALLVADELPASDPQKKVLLDYAKAWKEKYKTEFSTFGGHAYDGLFLFVDAAKRAGSLDREKLRNAIEQTKGFIGTAGTFNMSPTDHLGLTTANAFKMIEIRNGKWTLAE